MSQTKVTAYYNTRKRVAASKLLVKEVDTLPKNQNASSSEKTKPISMLYALKPTASKNSKKCVATLQVNEKAKPFQLTIPEVPSTKGKRRGKNAMTVKNNIKDAFEAQERSSKNTIPEIKSTVVKSVEESSENVLTESGEPQLFPVKPSTSTEPLVQIRTKTTGLTKKNNIKAAFETQKAAANKLIPKTKSTDIELIAENSVIFSEEPDHQNVKYDAPSTPKRILTNPEQNESPSKKAKCPGDSNMKHVSESNVGTSVYSTARKRLDLGSDEIISSLSSEERAVKITKASKQVVKKGKLTADKATAEHPKKQPKNAKLKATKSQKQLSLDDIGDVCEDAAINPKSRNIKATKSQKQLSLDTVTENVEAVVSIPSKSQKTKAGRVHQTDKKVSHDSTISDAKAKILASGRAEELKEKLSNFLKQTNKIEEFKNNNFHITSVITPSGSKADSCSSDDSQKLSPTEPENAYYKFGSLVSSDVTSLRLPYKFTILSKMFRSTDTIVQMLNNRKETCTFEKLRTGVQDMMKSSFTEFNFGQIMTVYPKAYYLRIEKLDSGFIDKKHGSNGYQLIIMPNLESEESISGNASPVIDNKQKLKNSKNEKNIESKVEPHSYIYMGPTHVIKRQEKFTSSLLQITMVHHKNFLSRMCPPIVVPEHKLQRWHPKFLLDKVPDIQAEPLPQPPEVKFSTARDVLNKIKENSSSRIKLALQKVAERSSPGTPEVCKSESSNNLGPNTTSSVLKGICTDLLERIRSRENAKIIENMTRSSEDTKKAAMIARIPMIVSILRTYFMVERKTAMALDDVVQKVIDSLQSSLTAESVKAHLQLISETLPDWLIVIKLPKGIYLKIDKNKDINELLHKLAVR